MMKSLCTIACLGLAGALGSCEGGKVVEGEAAGFESQILEQLSERFPDYTFSLESLEREETKNTYTAVIRFEIDGSAKVSPWGQW